MNWHNEESNQKICNISTIFFCQFYRADALKKIRKVSHLKITFDRYPLQWRSYGTLCPEARNIFAPPVIKSAEFKVKNRCKSAEEAKIMHCTGVILSFLDDNEAHLMLETNPTRL